MGTTRHSDEVYASRIATAACTGADLFHYDADIRAGKCEMTVHEDLDPKRANKAGKIIRESFDSDTHPESVPVGILFDITGSMAGVPRIFIKSLGKLMAALVAKGVLPHPQVLFGAFGDATCDQVPLQIGQFESGNEMDDVLTKIVLEGGGGSSDEESSELGLYFMARHTDLHSVSKRGRKGYLVIISDERPYLKIRKDQVLRLIGDTIQAHIPLETILKELNEKFEVFWVMPSGTNHWMDRSVMDPLKKLFGQRFILMEQPQDVVELICTMIATAQGYTEDEVVSTLTDAGLDKTAIARATSALAVYAKTTSMTKAAKVEGSLAPVGSDSVATL